MRYPYTFDVLAGGTSFAVVLIPATAVGLLIENIDWTADLKLPSSGRSHLLGQAGGAVLL